MIVYFSDRDMNVLGSASTGLPRGLTVTEDLKSEEVETGVAAFSCKLPYTPDTRHEVERCAAVGNYLFRNAGFGNELYTIIETEADTEAGTVYLYAEDAGLGLLNAVALAYAAESEQPITHYFEKWLDGTGFAVGVNEAGSEMKRLAWDDEATVTERLQDVAEQFGCELSFSFDIEGLNITGRYANIHRKRGKDIGAQLRLNEDVSRIVSKRTIENLATSLLAVGGTPSGSDIPATLEGYSYDDGDCYVSGRYLNSRAALEKWGETGPDGQRRHVVRLFTCDAASQEELCTQAVAELKKYGEAEVNYEIELARLPSGVRIGDRVNIVDDAGGLYLSARILKLETSIAEDTRTATLGEYLIQDSGIAQKVEELAAQVKASGAQSRYTWIAYADDAAGNGISLDPTGKAYMGTAANQTTETVDLSDPGIFTWVKVQGEKGEAGEPGTPGEPGADGKDAVSYAIESSAGTALRPDVASTVLTAHIYQGGAELDPDGAWDYTWYGDTGGGAQIIGNGKSMTLLAADIGSSMLVHFVCDDGVSTPVVGTDTADEVLAARLNAIEQSNADTATAINAVQAEMEG